MLNNILITILICSLFSLANIFYINSRAVPSVNQSQVVNVGNNLQNKININNCSLEALQRIPNVGRIKAKAIIANRPYKDVYEVEKIKGIGQKTINTLLEVATCE